MFDLKKKSFLILFLVTGILCVPIYSQQIQSEVKLMLERLPLEKQEELRNLGDELETYLNEYDWTGEDVEEPFPVSIQIFLKHKNVGYEDRYTGNFLITNRLDAQYYDKYWTFPFQAGDYLTHQTGVFHALTSFLDFYIYIIFAEEYDKFGKFLGSPYFEKAKEISDQAQFDSRYILGWRERIQLIDRLMGDESKSYREMKDMLFLGFSYVAEEDTTAQKYCDQALVLIEMLLDDDPDDKRTLQFLQAHRIELLGVFQNDPVIVNRMKKIDPVNVEFYNTILEQQ